MLYQAVRRTVAFITLAIVADPCRSFHLQSTSIQRSELCMKARCIKVREEENGQAKQHEESPRISCGESSNGSSSSSSSWCRRDFMSLPWIIGTTSAAINWSIDGTNIVAEATETLPRWGVSADHPVVVIGGGGRTGMEVARALAKEGIYTVTMTRTGKDPYQVVKLAPEIKSYLSHYPGQVDVVDEGSLQTALIDTVHPSAIIFCASASKQGGTAFQVDRDGVANVATIAKNTNARLVVVSALAVDRPESKSFQITNTLGGSFNGIMDAKRMGEEQVRKRLKDYVIIRPGPLVSGKTTTGPSGIEVNQGDTIGGAISRDELAGVVVGALVSGKRGVTVEVYRAATATVLQTNFSIPSGKEQRSETYAGLFSNVETDS